MGLVIRLEKTQIKIEHGVVDQKSVPWLRWLVAGFSPRRPGFDSRPVRVGFGMGEMVLGRIFLPTLLFFLLVSFHQCSVLIPSSTTDAVYSQQLTVPFNNTQKGQAERYTQLMLTTLPIEFTSVVFGRVSYSCFSQYYQNGHRICSLDTEPCT